MEQHNLPENLNLADLRARRAALNARLAKGLDALRQREESGDTGEQYEQWFCIWERLLNEYQDACDQFAALGAPACDYAPCRAETCAECKTLPAAPPPPPAALAVSWRVAGRAPGVFTSEAQVVGLARQLQAFAAGAPILALPAFAGGENDAE
jgi:hypothetical protein